MFSPLVMHDCYIYLNKLKWRYKYTPFCATVGTCLWTHITLHYIQYIEISFTTALLYELITRVSLSSLFLAGKTQVMGEIKVALKKEVKTEGDQLVLEILQCRNITYKFKSPDHLPGREVVCICAHACVGFKKIHIYLSFMFDRIVLYFHTNPYLSFF